MATAGESSATSMTWEELESYAELNRSRNSQGTLIKIEDNSKEKTQNKALSVNAHSQKVQILRRQPKSDPCLSNTESNATSDGTSSGNGRAIKTLEEREAAYAEARARILGSSSSPATPSPPVNPQANVKRNNNNRTVNNQTNSRSNCPRGGFNNNTPRSYNGQRFTGNKVNLRSPPTNQNCRFPGTATSDYRVLT